MTNVPSMVFGNVSILSSNLYLVLWLECWSLDTEVILMGLWNETGLIFTQCRRLLLLQPIGSHNPEPWIQQQPLCSAGSLDYSHSYTLHHAASLHTAILSWKEDTGHTKWYMAACWGLRVTSCCCKIRQLSTRMYKTRENSSKTFSRK